MVSDDGARPPPPGVLCSLQDPVGTTARDPHHLVCRLFDVPAPIRVAVVGLVPLDAEALVGLLTLRVTASDPLANGIGQMREHVDRLA